MTVFALLGTNSSFFISAFFNGNGAFAVDVLSQDATTLVINNPATGITTTLTGTGFQFTGPPGAEEPVAGTITSLSMSSNNNTVLQGTLTGVSLDLVAFSDALGAVSSDGFQPLADQFNSNGAITVDASMANNGLIMFALLPPNLTLLLTQPTTVIGSPGFDAVFGGLGDDTILFGGNTNFFGGVISATPGNDTIDFSNTTEFDGPFVNYSALVDGAVTININTDTNVSTVEGNGFTDTLVDMRRILENGNGLGIGASEGDDTFNVVLSQDATIRLNGAQGDDTFNLTLDGTARLTFSAADTFFTPLEPLASGVDVDLSTGLVSDDGFGGQDTINFQGGTGTLEVNGTSLNDALTGSDRDDRFFAVGGADIIVGGLGNDSVEGGNGNDTVMGGDGDDTLRGGNGNDSLVDGLGDDFVFGGDGNDIFSIGSGQDTFNGGEGFDTVLIEGTGNAAPQSFEAEVNLLAGTAGIVGNPALDDVLINIEAVELIGDFNITVTGDDVSNLINTDQGTDSLIGGLGDDTLMAGAGNDTLVGNEGRDILLGENGNDRLDAGANTDSVVGGNGDDTIFGGGQNDTLRGANGDDVVFGGNGRDVVFLGTGNDVFFDNIQSGEFGSDVVFGFDGNDTINGGAGDDRFLGQSGRDVVLGRSGDDSLSGGAQNDTLEGGSGNDTVNGGNGADQAILGGGDDLWIDNTQVQFGNDSVFGGGGDDTLQAGGGNDTLGGGGGADTFVLAASINDDVITDYDVGTDALDITASLWDGALTQGRLNALTSVQNGNLVFDFDNGDSLTLNGVTSTAGLLGDIDLI